MIIIGEKINGSIPSVADAIARRMRNLSRKEPEFRRKPALPLLTAALPCRRQRKWRRSNG